MALNKVFFKKRPPPPLHLHHTTTILSIAKNILVHSHIFKPPY